MGENGGLSIFIFITNYCFHNSINKYFLLDVVISTIRLI
jgi:hypothetical protein